MTKHDLIKDLAERFSKFKAFEIEHILDTAFAEIYKTVKRGERATYRWFIFKRTHVKERKNWFNPLTKKTQRIPAKNFLTCKILLDDGE